MSHQDLDSSLSGSDLECSAMVQSDSDDAGTSGRSFNRLEVDDFSKIALDFQLSGNTVLG